MYDIFTIALVIIAFLLIMFLPVFIAKKRGLTSDRLLIIKICTWLSPFTGITWLVAFVLSLFLTPNKDIETSPLNALSNSNENDIKELPKEKKELGSISSLLLFALSTFFYGNFYHTMGPWMLIFGLCFIFLAIQIKLFYNISSKSKYWTILYSLFSMSSVYWMLLLDEYHNEGSGAQAESGLYLYFLISGILALFAKFLHKSNIAKCLVTILFIMGGYGVLNYYSIKATSICPQEKPLMDVYGRCYECSDTRALENIGNCSVCPNRSTYGDYKRCAITQCPTDYPLRNSVFGDCYACDDTGSLLYVKNCDVCLNRASDEQDHCFLKNCPDDLPLRALGSCHSCDELRSVWVKDQAACDVCGSKRKLYGDVGLTKEHLEYCGLITCPEGYVLGKVGDCYKKIREGSY